MFNDSAFGNWSYRFGHLSGLFVSLIHRCGEPYKMASTGQFFANTSPFLAYIHPSPRTHVFLRYHRRCSRNRGKYLTSLAHYESSVNLWPQFEFVNQLSAKPENTVFALVRSLATSQKLVDLKAKNVHILQADITDVPALKVTRMVVLHINSLVLINSS